MLEKIRIELASHASSPPEVLPTEKLRELGIASDADLLPLLEAQNPSAVRVNVLELLGRFDSIQPGTQERVGTIGKLDPDEAVRYRAARLAWEKWGSRDWGIARTLVTFANLDWLRHVMGGITQAFGHEGDLGEEGEAVVRLCFQRLKTVAATERVNMRLLAVVFAAEAAPFANPRFERDKIESFLACLKRADNFSDLEFVTVFRIFRYASPTLGQTLQQAFTEVIQSASEPLVTLFLWQLYYQKMIDTEAGKAIREECLRRYPALSAFCDLLAQAAFKPSYFGEGEVSRKVQDALQELWTKQSDK